MSKKAKRERRAAKPLLASTTQSCCGAPKNGHYSTCQKGGKR
jgi:hypothetical protein